MHSISDILAKFNPVEDKYISREFQTYGLHLCEVLGDYNNKSLYMKLAQVVPRPILERALSFVHDSTAENKAKLFMWKLKEMRNGIPELAGKKRKKTRTSAGSVRRQRSAPKSDSLPLFS